MKHRKIRVLVLGATGMLGNSVFRLFSADDKYEAFGSIRSPKGMQYFPEKISGNLIAGIDVLDPDQLLGLFARVKPEIVINCVGLIKQLDGAEDPLVALPINAILPHRLSRLCEALGSRLIHISTDCVFSGEKGAYIESDVSDALDLYGKSKYIGELHDKEHVVTLRTSIIGHELNTTYALINWFLSQNGRVKGFSKAFFSGLPTIELARVIKDYVITQPDLHGLYHVSADPVSKLNLLKLVAERYSKSIEIVPDDTVIIDRSLVSDCFTSECGYKAPPWNVLIDAMYRSQ